MADAPKINPTDTLRESYPKLNQAIDNANEALRNSEEALNTANQALTNSENTQEQLDQIVIEGDSSVEAAQARVDADGNVFTTLKERLDTKEQSFSAQLAQIDRQTNSIGDYLGYAHRLPTLFVSNENGNDNNPGGIKTPLKTINKALEKLQNGKGGNILILEGIYNEKIYIPNENITEDKTLTIKNYNYEKVIIDGTNLTAGSLLSNFRDHVTIEGIEFQNYWGDDENVQCIRNFASHFTVKYCVFHDIGVTSPTSNSATIINIYGTDADIQNGVEISRQAKNIKILNNKIYNCVCGWGEGITSTGNVYDITIEYNEIDNVGNIGINIGGGYPQASYLNPSNNFTKKALVRRNVVKNCYSPNNTSAAGIYVDSGQDVVVEQNIVINCATAYNVGSEVPGYHAMNIIFRNNLAYDCENYGLQLGAFEKSTNGLVSDVKVYNNTIVNCGRRTSIWVGMCQINAISDLEIKNNIFADFREKPEFVNEVEFISNSADDETSNIVIDNNIYFAPSNISPRFKFRGVIYNSLSDFSSATGFDEFSMYVDPEFADLANNVYKLKETSPALNAGEVVPEIGKVDLEDNIRVVNGTTSIGCYQNQSYRKEEEKTQDEEEIFLSVQSGYSIPYNYSKRIGRTVHLQFKVFKQGNTSFEQNTRHRIALLPDKMWPQTFAIPLSFSLHDSSGSFIFAPASVVVQPQNGLIDIYITGNSGVTSINVSGSYIVS